MSGPDRPSRRLLVSGLVQGVFYRNWAVAQARELGLAGWVRNLRSGEVELLAIGSDDALQSLVERCRRGPPAAVVEDVKDSEGVAEPVEGFEKRPTA